MAERTMCALTMNGAFIWCSSSNVADIRLIENVFVWLEDPAAPTRGDILAQAAASGESAQNQALILAGPSHYRTTFLTLNPPGALEQLITQLKARWVPVRQSGVTGTQPSRTQNQSQTSGQQLTIDGHIYAIGSDWLVRAGNVILAGGAVKGMFLEVSRFVHLPKVTTARSPYC